MESERRPRLSPAIADVRRAVRAAVVELVETGSSDAESPLVLVALSGGPDSLALAAATAFEAPRVGLRAGAVIVDHGLQTGSADVAARGAKPAGGTSRGEPHSRQPGSDSRPSGWSACRSAPRGDRGVPRRPPAARA